MYINFPEIHIPMQGMEDVRIPRMVKVKQLYDPKRIDDIAGHVRAQMDALRDHEQYRGKKLCITAGSRGIPHLDLIIRSIIDVLKEWGAEPFIVPAMGSHGGATAEGQLEVLETYNITEETMGVPVKSCMDVVQLGTLDDGTPVYCDKFAAESDGVILLNKVKPHTDVRGKYESGMLKMLAIGLAKHKGASMFHMKGFAAFPSRFPQIYDVFMQHNLLAFGCGIVQNAYDDISYIEIMEKEQIAEKDAELLVIAKKSIANLKMKDVDVLIVDQIGKNISGNGTDPNVTGRSNSPGFEDILNMKKMFVRGITEETHHNGCGIAAADMTTRRTLNDIDFEMTWTNVATSTMLIGGKIPMYAETDEEALRLCIRTCNGIDLSNPHIVHIRDTLSCEYIEVSENYLPELRGNPEIEILSEPFDMPFDKDGFMITSWEN